MELDEIITALQTAFEKMEVKEIVLDKYWHNLNIETGIHTTGFCFAASEVIYRLNGGKINWTIKRIIDPSDWNNGTHYFLQSKNNNEILDVTSSQYERRNIVIPYHLAKGTGLHNVSNKARLLARLSGLGEL